MYLLQKSKDGFSWQEISAKSVTPEVIRVWPAAQDAVFSFTKARFLASLTFFFSLEFNVVKAIINISLQIFKKKSSQN